MFSSVSLFPFFSDNFLKSSETNILHQLSLLQSFFIDVIDIEGAGTLLIMSIDYLLLPQALDQSTQALNNA